MAAAPSVCGLSGGIATPLRADDLRSGRQLHEVPRIGLQRIAPLLSRGCVETVKEDRVVAEEHDFAVWVSARGEALQRFAFLVTGNVDEAAELVQEALSRVYPRWRLVSGSGTTEAYVRRCISLLRQRLRRRNNETSPHRRNGSTALGRARAAVLRQQRTVPGLS